MSYSRNTYKIAFHCDKLCFRGTSVAMYDYADYNEKILNNKSIIFLSEEGLKQSDINGLLRFLYRFKIVLFSNKENLEKLLEQENIDILYCIKYGKNDGMFSSTKKTVIHCVFDMSEPHGNVYAGVSKSLASKFNTSDQIRLSDQIRNKLYVPHMISLNTKIETGNLREKLGIPNNSIVFGRYGGSDTFNLQFCWDVIKLILSIRSDIYFLFINAPIPNEKYNHPHIIHYPVITEEKDKLEFIRTCDAYLECGTMGHSFGLAIGEFSICGKPIIAYKSDTLWNTSHIDILGNRGIYFSNFIEFFFILNSFIPYKTENCYSEYTPEKVMSIFEKVFILEN